MGNAISSPCPPRVYVLVDQILVRAVFFTIATRWMEKQNVVNTRDGILFDLGNEKSSDTHYSMGIP